MPATACVCVCVYNVLVCSTVKLYSVLMGARCSSVTSEVLFTFGALKITVLV